MMFIFPGCRDLGQRKHVLVVRQRRIPVAHVAAKTAENLQLQTGVRSWRCLKSHGSSSSDGVVKGSREAPAQSETLFFF